MREVFADADYWVARVNPLDALHSKAIQVTRQLIEDAGSGGVRFMTTDGVLAEALLLISSGGDGLHRGMTALVAGFLGDSQGPLVLFSTAARLARGLELYRREIGELATLQDGISLAIVEERSITDVLTHDPTFEHYGHRCLLRDGVI